MPAHTITDTPDARTSFSIAKGANIYGYDKLNRLLSATHPTPPAEAFTYDPVGNRLTQAGNPATWQYNRANRLLNDGRFTYGCDNNGNQTSKTEIANPGNTKIPKYQNRGQVLQSHIPPS